MLLFVVLLAVLLGATVFSAITFTPARGFVEVVVVGRAVIAVTLATTPEARIDRREASTSPQ